jgi:hypothetical protein
MRPYRDDEDDRRFRAFLCELFLLNDRRELTWQTARWDYWRWPGVESWGAGPLGTHVYLWEDDTAQLAAVLNIEGPGDAYFQLHPQRRDLDLVIAAPNGDLAASPASGSRTSRAPPTSSRWAPTRPTSVWGAPAPSSGRGRAGSTTSAPPMPSSPASPPAPTASTTPPSVPPTPCRSGE